MLVNESQHARDARAAKRAHALSLGIDDTFIATMIDRFYAKIRSDLMLGPIFASHVADWAPHLERMNLFWRSVLFSSGEFTGNPMLKHVVIPDLDRRQFAQWLALFDETLIEIGTAPARILILERARNIANSLLNAVNIHSGRGIGLSKADEL
ncbi:group III truncated hemoglobin [Sphingomonas sp. 22R3R2A-7]|uniref:group III truncated hemoglobin n=1 Tax=Sphingomonas sp. 22R3R2A-7 TaxID=3050230 RepID=UPI002FE1C766